MGSVTVVARGALLEGRVVSDGEVIVEAGAEVRAEVRARRVIVRGVIRGDVIATEVRLEEGGRLIGGLRTPAAEAAVAVANAAARPVAARSPVTPAMADELARAVARDTAAELANALDGDPLPPMDGDSVGDPPGMGAPAGSNIPPPAAVAPTGPDQAPSRRVVAVRRGSALPDPGGPAKGNT